MTKVLIAWELGEAFGHLSRCLLLAESLHQRGYDITLVLKDVKLPGQSKLISTLPVLSIPRVSQNAKYFKKRPPVNHAELLTYNGFYDEEGLYSKVNSWQSLYKIIKPDLVIADHAPTALFSSRICDITNISVCNGFSSPPDIFPWPSIRPWDKIPQSYLVKAEERLNFVTASVQKKIGVSNVVKMRDVYKGAHVLTTIPELDHYSDRKEGLYVGPIVNIPKCDFLGWNTFLKNKILVYLRPDVPAFYVIMQALMKVDAEVICITPGLDKNYINRFLSKNVRISLNPIDLPTVLTKADLAISYGNSGFSMQALFSGVPVLMSPKNVEQMLFAMRVESMGLGGIISKKSMDVLSVLNMINRFLVDKLMLNRVMEFSTLNEKYNSKNSIKEVMVSIESLLDK